MTEPLPALLAGPILRQTTRDKVSIWFITSESYSISVELNSENGETLLTKQNESVSIETIRVGANAFVNLATLHCQQDLVNGSRYFYDIYLDNNNGNTGLASRLPSLVYPGQTKPSFIFSQSLTNILHGSCRKPHFDGEDGLLAVDQKLQETFDTTRADTRPDLLIMSGDQVYVDDVAGPMLVAIRQVISRLGLFEETPPRLTEDTGEQIQASLKLNEQEHLYKRDKLLPDTESNQQLISQFFKGKKKPIFTSVNAKNHLITFAEVIAMYTLVWSPELWDEINFDKRTIAPEHREAFDKELDTLLVFRDGLSQVRRALAHLPVYMIFDDHDVTDDWNLTRAWEEAVYSNPTAKRIIGNAMIGYWLCQGWGNDIDAMKGLKQELSPHFGNNAIVDHDTLIDKLLKWDHWHFTLNTEPKVVVLDTRTQRWRSESNPNKPSGLMDWESLCEFQQEVIDQKAVIVISAAPIFGVKLIEAIQKVFIFFGKPLVVDAENWMAHRGTANVILNIFRHKKTPPNFVILSGDVHYSFVYDVTLRKQKDSPKITQITSSGIKNEFPSKLLAIFDTLNRVLYHVHSPLNWFTKRRDMNIEVRKPSGGKTRTLLNASGIGLLNIDETCTIVEASTLKNDGTAINFESRHIRSKQQTYRTVDS